MSEPAEPLLIDEAVRGSITYRDFRTERRVAVAFSVHQNDWLRVDTDAGRFGSALSGRVEYRFRTAHAARIVDLAGEGGRR